MYSRWTLPPGQSHGPRGGSVMGNEGRSGAGGRPRLLATVQPKITTRVTIMNKMFRALDFRDMGDLRELIKTQRPGPNPSGCEPRRTAIGDSPVSAAAGAARAAPLGRQ